MGVFTFVCKSNDGVWNAKQYNGDVEASAESTYDLDRKLVQQALTRDSSGPLQSNFSLGTPTSAVLQVIICGSFTACDSRGGTATPNFVGIAVAEAHAAEEKKEDKEETDDEIDNFFDDMFG